MPSLKSCHFLHNPEEIEDKEGNARLRIIYIKIKEARGHGHSDCFEAILAMNGDHCFLSGFIGKILLKEIDTFLYHNVGHCFVRTPNAVDHTLLKALLKYGVGVNDFLKHVPKFNLHAPKSSPVARGYVYPISIVMNHHCAETLAIMLQKPYGSMNRFACKRLHNQVLCLAVKTANEDLLHQLIEAGANKQELLSKIQHHKTLQHVTTAQAERMTRIVNKRLSLKEMNRLVIWSSLSQLRDVMYIGLPITLVRVLLFEEEASSGFPVSTKLKAEM